MPGIGANGHSLTWDGRVMIKTVYSATVGAGVHEVVAIRPQNFLVSDNNIDSTQAFSSPYLWAASNHGYQRLSNPPPTLEPMPLKSVNALAVTKDVDYSENPYRSNEQGVANQNGAFDTYRTVVYVQDYPICEPTGADCDPNSVPVHYHIGFYKVQIIVRNPRTAHAEIESVHRTTGFQPIYSKTGAPIVGIEPTLTADGRLLIFQTAPNFGTIVFTFNEGTFNNPSWTNPLPISELYNTMRNLPVRTSGGEMITFSQLYRIAQYPMRLADGTGIDGRSFGAYPWIDLDGEDLFLTTVVLRKEDGTPDGVRAGQAVIGASTRGMLNHIDGGVNSDRYRLYRLFVSSFGRTPGRWTPPDLAAGLPITQKRITYPVFASNSHIYFETSLEESVAGDYDLFLPMSEALRYSSGAYDYDLTKTQDASGHFHFATLQGSPQFSDDFFNCTFLCDQNQEERYSGKAMYFKPTDSLVVHHQSPTGHTLLSQQGMTLSFAIKLLREPGTYNFIAQKNGVFHLVLEANRQLHFSIYDEQGEKRSGFMGPQLPLNQWVHVAFTYNGQNGKMKYYLDGQLAEEKVLGRGALATAVTGLLLGPTSADGGAALYALDQVALSSFERPLADISRQMFGQRRIVIPKQASQLPLGLDPKDQVFARDRQLNSELVDLGRHLFFDKTLSSNGTISCASCHQPDKAWTDGRGTALGIQNLVLKRNTPSLLNMSFNSSFFWDGRSSSLADQAHAVILNPQEMGGDFAKILTYLSQNPQYQPLLKGQTPTASLVESALAEFELSLLSGNAKHDRVIAGTESFTELEQQGRDLFNGRARCAECHTGSNFSDGLFHNVGFLSGEDQGRFVTTANSLDRFKFKTPSLRNIERTAPYFHDGSVATLEAVVALYNTASQLTQNRDAVIAPLGLNATEERALVAYLKTLTGQLPSIQIPTIADFKPTVIQKFDEAAASAAITQYYQDILKRAPTAADLNYYVGEARKGRTLANIRNEILNSKEAQFVNAISQYFRDHLRREATAADYVYYVGQAMNNRPLAEISEEIRTSPEAIAKGYYKPPTSFDEAGARAAITQYYQEIFFRAPDTAGLNYYLNQARGGRALAEIRTELYASSEAQYVRAISQYYRDHLRREPDIPGLLAHVQEAMNGRSLSEICEAIRTSQEAIDKGYYKPPVAIDFAATITQYYREILGREPDEGGLAGYVRQAQNGLSLNIIRDAIMNSVEANNRRAVSDCYRTHLHREPDAAGLTWYMGEIATERMSVAQACENIRTSQEARDKGYYP